MWSIRQNPTKQKFKQKRPLIAKRASRENIGNASNEILSPVCLPIPPSGRNHFNNLQLLQVQEVLHFTVV